MCWSSCDCPLCRPGRWLAVAALALVACGPAAPELTPHERAAVHAALEGWRLAGLPEPTKQKCDFGAVSIRRPEAADFVRLCHGSVKGVASCLHWDTSNFGGRQLPVIVLRPGQQIDAVGDPAVHEICHGLMDCSELEGWNGPPNYRHLSPLVWSAAETVPGSSAQSRARALMAGQP